jgi:hypothetical protein
MSMDAASELAQWGPKFVLVDPAEMDVRSHAAAVGVQSVCSAAFVSLKCSRGKQRLQSKKIAEMTPAPGATNPSFTHGL